MLDGLLDSTSNDELMHETRKRGNASNANFMSSDLQEDVLAVEEAKEEAAPAQVETAAPAEKIEEAEAAAVAPAEENQDSASENAPKAETKEEPPSLFLPAAPPYLHSLLHDRLLKSHQ